MGRFPYIKQNSIAEIVSTMESFLVAERGLVTSHLRALLGVIILFTARAQIVVIRAANDKEVWRHFVNEKEKQPDWVAFLFV